MQLASGGFWGSVVWVSVDVELDLDAGYDLVAEAGFSVTGGAGARVEAAPALRYDGSAWSVSMPAPTPTLVFVGPTVDGYARLNPLQLYLKPELELVFSGYGMEWIAHGDATVSAKTFVGLDAEVTATDYAWSFYVGQEYAVGLEFDTWLTDEWDVEYPVYDWQTELASGGASLASSIDLTVYQLTGGNSCNGWDENNVYWGSHSCSTSTLTSFTWQTSMTDACFSLGSVNLADLRDEGMAIGESTVSGTAVMFQDREHSSTYPALAMTYTECY